MMRLSPCGYHNPTLPPPPSEWDIERDSHNLSGNPLSDHIHNRLPALQSSPHERRFNDASPEEAEEAPVPKPLNRANLGR